MSIEIKRSIKPVEYNKAIELLEKRLQEINDNRSKELIWFLEHNEIYTAGTSFTKNDILDKSIKKLMNNQLYCKSIWTLYLLVVQRKYHAGHELLVAPILPIDN